VLLKELEVQNLSQEQEAFIEAIESSSDHFFVTGKAGTGKSTLLQALKQKTKKKFVVAAPTGVAALNIGGQTLHSLFKLPIKFQDPVDINPSKSVLKLLSKIELLIIDEVSMLRADILDSIDYILRQAKESDEAFGGVQIVLFGDLYQLPPIINDKELEAFFKERYLSHYFFSALAWREADLRVLELKDIFRQDETEFQNILNSIRVRSFDSDLLRKLNSRVQSCDDKSVITLALTNKTVSSINETRLDDLTGQSFEYEADIQGDFEKSAFPTDENLVLKEGAQVMFLKNDPEKRWVNGSIGEVEYLSDDCIEVSIDGESHEIKKTKWEKIRYYYDEEAKKIKEEVTSSFTQYPLRLAWAITVHKSQGQSLDKVIFDIERGAFAHGQTYVALSRCRSFETLYLKRPIRPRDIIVDLKIRDFFLEHASY
jgi:ATP-dependent DNA helicase PIF1